MLLPFVLSSTHAGLRTGVHAACGGFVPAYELPIATYLPSHQHTSYQRTCVAGQCRVEFSFSLPHGDHVASCALTHGLPISHMTFPKVSFFLSCTPCELDGSTRLHGAPMRTAVSFPNVFGLGPLTCLLC